MEQHKCIGTAQDIRRNQTQHCVRFYNTVLYRPSFFSIFSVVKLQNIRNNDELICRMVHEKVKNHFCPNCGKVSCQKFFFFEHFHGFLTFF
jgi:hypothetical protein